MRDEIFFFIGEASQTERLEFLAENTGFTKRFALGVGRLCGKMTVQDVAKLMNLDWHTVKRLDKQYMGMQLEAAPEVRPQVMEGGSGIRRRAE